MAFNREGHIDHAERSSGQTDQVFAARVERCRALFEQRRKIRVEKVDTDAVLNLFDGDVAGGFRQQLGVTKRVSQSRDIALYRRQGNLLKSLRARQARRTELLRNAFLLLRRCAMNQPENKEEGA